MSIIQSHNNEKIFFADHVVLVEGLSERIVFERMLRNALALLKRRDVIEVVEVLGKKSFDSYRKLLTSLDIGHHVIADQDYLVDASRGEIADLFVTNHKKISEEVIRKRKSQDGASLAREISNYIKTGDAAELSRLWEYIESRHRRIKDNLTSEEEQRRLDALIAMESDNIIVLKLGEIEDYMPKDQRSLDAIIELFATDRWFAALEHNACAELIGIAERVLDVQKGSLAAAFGVQETMVSA